MSRTKSQARYGRVSSVLFNEGKNDIFVNVVIGPNREPRYMKFSSPAPGIWYVPSEGDMVEVHNINGTKTARFPANPPKEYGVPDNVGEGDVCFRLNENTQLHFSNQDDGTVDVELTTDGRLTIHAEDGFDILDGDGYGIVSEGGAGSFTWHHSDVDFSTSKKES